MSKTEKGMKNEKVFFILIDMCNLTTNVVYDFGLMYQYWPKT